MEFSHTVQAHAILWLEWLGFYPVEFPPTAKAGVILGIYPFCREVCNLVTESSASLTLVDLHLGAKMGIQRIIVILDSVW